MGKPKEVEALLGAEDTYTPTLSFKGHEGNLSISGTWDGTLTLQRSFDGGHNWRDVEEFTENIETIVADPEDEVLYRVGFKTSAFTSGAALIRLGW